jgi:hypothetical protein
MQNVRTLPIARSDEVAAPPAYDPDRVELRDVRLRTKVTKGAGSKKAALATAYKLLAAAQARWRRFNGHELIADVLAGVAFKDGERVLDEDNHNSIDEKVAV